MDYQLTLLIITGFVTALMAIYVFMRSPQGEVQQAYIILITFFVLWAFIRATVYATSDLELAATLERVTYVLGLGIAWSFLNFAKKFPYKIDQISRTFQIICSFLTGISFLSILTSAGLIAFARLGVDVHDKVFVINLFWLTLYNGIFVSTFLYSFYLLMRKYRDTSGEARLQLKYVLLTTLIAVFAGLVFNLLSPYVNDYKYQVYGPSFTLPFTLVVAYLVFFRNRN